MSSASSPASHAEAIPPGWMRPDLGQGARALMSARAGGISVPPYDACNLGDHVGDAPEAVAHNRDRLAACLAAQPVWMTQVHGNRVVRLRASDLAALDRRADGAVCTEPGLACVVMVADCLPLLLAAPQGRGVAALHAGWRGLAGVGALCEGGHSIVRTGVQALCDATSADPADLRVWLGPCIGPTQFEVGADVLQGFGVDPGAAQGHPRFRPAPTASGQPKWWADLAGLARDVLNAQGVQQVTGGTWCTASDGARFFSYRRDGRCGRQAAAICCG